MPKKIAIYSRKSKFTGTGDSVENQIELCKEYATRQFGGDCEFLIYEDEGFSGKNTDRPEFQRLLSDMQREAFEVLMCYRLDRISRSVSDFSTILDDLTDRDIDFVSIRENFDTSTPIGRAMIHIASVFAELERETIAERIKDNKYKLYRTGHWQGGNPPTGFEAVKVQGLDQDGSKRSHFILKPVEDQLKDVRLMFDKYLEYENLSRVETFMIQSGIKTYLGNDYNIATIQRILTNPVYATNDPCVYDYLQSEGADLANDKTEYDGTHGLMSFGKNITKGAKHTTRVRVGRDGWIVAIAQHEGIIPGGKWVSVQEKLTAGRDKFPRANTSSVALLSGLIRCGKCGAPMFVKGNRRKPNGEMSYFYVCTKKSRSNGELCDMKNINGLPFDREIIGVLKERLSQGGSVFENLEEGHKHLKNEKNDLNAKIKSLEQKIKHDEGSLVKIALRLTESDTPEGDAAIYTAYNALSANIESMNRQLEQLQRENADSESRQVNLEIVRQAAESFCETIDAKPLEAKRDAIRVLVDHIIWKGSNYEIELFPDSLGPKKNELLLNLNINRTISCCLNYILLNNTQTVGEQCRVLRTIQNLTLSELSDRLHVNPVSISRFERNHRVGISDDTIRIIEQYVNSVRLNDHLSGEPP